MQGQGHDNSEGQAGGTDHDFDRNGDREVDVQGPGNEDFGSQGDNNVLRSPDPQPDNQTQRERPAIDIEELARQAVLAKIKTAMDFILALRSASLDDPVAKLNEETRSNLRNPPREPPDIINPIIHHSISTYYALEHSSQTAYERIRASTARTYPDADEMPSFYRIERMIAEYTGVESITHDMCPDTCITFTGPFADLNHWSVCRPRSLPCLQQTSI